MINYKLLPASFCLERRLEINHRHGVTFYYRFDACTKQMRFHFPSDNYISFDSDDEYEVEQYLVKNKATHLINYGDEDDDYYRVDINSSPEKVFTVDVHFPPHWIQLNGSCVKMWCEYKDTHYLMNSLPNTQEGYWCLNLNEYSNHNLVYCKMFEGIGNYDYHSSEQLRFFYRVLELEERQFHVFDEEQFDYKGYKRGGERFPGCLLPEHIESIAIEKSEIEIVSINNNPVTDKTPFSNMFTHNE